MTREEARELLIRYRSEQLDGRAGGMSEALAFLEEDEELREWFADTREFHGSVRAALRELPVPADLRAKITKRPKVVPLTSRREFFWGAIAASVALAGTGTIWYRSRDGIDRTARNFETRMVEYAVRAYGMDIETGNQGELRNFLAKEGAPSQFGLPGRLGQLPVKGGASLTWNSKPVAMMCFEVENKTGYLFVLEDADVEGTDLEQVRTKKYGGVSSALWKREGKLYLFAAEVEEKALKDLIAS